MKRPDHEIRLLRAAEDDLQEIVSYIAADHPAAAEGVAVKIEKGLLQLSRNPRLGRVPDEKELSILGYRHLIIENYLIFYTIEDRTALIHRILHSARAYQGLL